MLIINISIHEGLYNQTCLRIIDLTDNIFTYMILAGYKVGEIILLSRYILIMNIHLLLKGDSFLLNYLSLSLLTKTNTETNIF